MVSLDLGFYCLKNILNTFLILLYFLIPIKLYSISNFYLPPFLPFDSSHYFRNDHCGSIDNYPLYIFNWVLSFSQSDIYIFDSILNFSSFINHINIQNQTSWASRKLIDLIVFLIFNQIVFNY